MICSANILVVIVTVSRKNFHMLDMVRPELYSVMHKLSSKYHMSKSQIEGSIIAIANILFWREWRPYAPREEHDLNTLPSMKNLVHTEPYFKAMALSLIVEEMMSEDTITSIAYSNDGSSMSGLGSNAVQSLTLSGVQKCLPSFGIFTESCESLKDLEICTLKILSASCCHEYSEKEMLQHIKFVMTDSTSHNLNVINQVAEELEAESVPSTLLCNVHPLMMFQGKIKGLCQQIHDSLGNQKINECFLVDIEFKNQSFIIKSLNCLLYFIN